jgi:hypothetical protein
MQNVHILQHDSADTGSLPMEDLFQTQYKLLPNNPARQWYRYASVPTEAAMFDTTFQHKNDDLLVSVCTIYRINKVHIAERYTFVSFL